MTFSSITFFVFFAIVYASVLVFNLKFVRKKFSDKKQLLIKHSILLVSSYVFYGWWDYRFCFLMAALTLISWFCATKIHKNKCRQFYAAVGIVVPLIVLGIFKYFNFFISSFAQLFNIRSIGALNIILPVGISFYTFQTLSYTIDVIRGKAQKHSLLNVALYVSFFPQLVAGPIVRASDFMPQLKNNSPLKLRDFSEGIQIFVFGLFKKIVIADNLSVFVDDVFAKPFAFSSLSVILAVISYSIQIYCDFSGYSDMAVGVARCLGYKFLPNFNMPYLSRNVSEFWKRWHISLSTWLQEYLYIPLGGNRKGPARRYINLLVTMLLGGLWHGANYTFIFWGLLHGIALCLHKLYLQYTKNKQATIAGTILSTSVTYAFVCVCWVFFRSDNFRLALDVLRQMFSWSNGITQIFSWTIFSLVIMIAAGIVAAVRSKKCGEKTVNGRYVLLNLNKTTHLIIFFSVIMLIACLAYTRSNPFIYFQF